MPVGTIMTNLFNGKSVNYISGVEVIKEEVKFLIGFQKYSLFFGNNIGLGPEKFLHLTDRLATYNLIKEEIEKLFSSYRRAKLLEVRMEFNESTSAVVITLTLATGSYANNTFNVSFSLTE